MKMTFTDGSYIEETESGLVYVGEEANKAGHIIRKTNCSLALFKKAFDGEVNRLKANLN